MRHLLYSDIHLKEDNLHIQEKIHDEILKIGHRQSVISSGGFFINGGDTFNTRGLIRTSCFDFLYQTRKKWLSSGVHNHIDIVGNHDQEDKDGHIHPMRVFSQFGDNWHVVDEPTFIPTSCGFHCFPYMADLESEIKTISTSKRKGRVAIVHTGVHGAFKNDGELDDFSIWPKAFKGFKRVFSGHYHNRHLYGDIIQYIGSPFQHSFSEMDQEKGVLIYDDEKDTVEFCPIDGPRHYEIKVQWDDGKKIIEKPDGITKSDIVRVRVHGTSDQVSLVTRNDFKIDCASLKIERKTKDSISSRIKVDGASQNDLLKMYIDYVDPDLDRDRLVQIGEKFINANV